MTEREMYLEEVIERYRLMVEQLREELKQLQYQEPYRRVSG